jgi:hypothetical protein
VTTHSRCSRLAIRGSLQQRLRGAGCVLVLTLVAGALYRFEHSRFFTPIDWTVRFLAYTDPTGPVKQPQALEKLVTGLSVRTVTTDRLDYVSGRAIEHGVPQDEFAVVAEGTAKPPRGDYVRHVISDDGVSVWVDDALELDSWEPHESKVGSVLLDGGERLFKVQYFEVGGFAELRFDIQRR